MISSFVLLMLRERLLSWYHTDRVTDLPIGCHISDQDNHHVVIKLNDAVGVVCDHAVLGEQGVQEGTKHTLLRGPMLRVSMGYELLPTLTTWGQPVRKSRIQLQAEVFSPRILSLVMSLEGTMVLNSEQLSYVYWWERAVWSAIEICIIWGSVGAVCELE
jgi:hypothetical protein